jgi:pimeloyl-ACP methyl ester carboxylesterase
MPTFQRDDIALDYHERGEGFPILLFAPGGMRSAASFWEGAPWNPLTALSDRYRVVAMDQRNAGASTAPVTPEDGWADYAADHVALLDHLGVERCHVIGGCIGGSYAFGLMQAAPGRVAAAVLQQPIGFDGSNRQAFYEMFDSWAVPLAAEHPRMTQEGWDAFRGRMYDGDFVFNVDREFVRACEAPLLVLMGNDLYHPEVTSREIAKLAPHAELVESWKKPDRLAATVDRVRTFLGEHTS